MNRLTILRRFSHVSFVVAVVLCTACSAPPEPEEEPEANLPPPPTPLEIANKIALDSQIDGPIPARGAALPPRIRNRVISIFRNAKVEHSGTEDGEHVLAILANKLESRIEQTKDRNLYQHTLTYIEAYEVLNPNAARFDHVRNNIIEILTQPKVEVVGIGDAGGRRFARLRITKPLEGKTFTVSMEPGEEAHGLRFLEFFGENRGVRMEYISTSERFNALFDRDK